MTIDTPTKWDDKLKLIMKELLALSGTEKDELLQMLQQDTNGNQLENVEISQELREYREKWKEKILYISDESKEKIIEAADKIPVKVETDSEGSRLIEFKLGNKTYKILDPKLEGYTDYEYKANTPITKISRSNIMLRGMMGDDTDKWSDENLKTYVEHKQLQGFHIPRVEEKRALLNKLGEEAGLTTEDDKVAMLMYLTGMEGYYWLGMGDDKTSNGRAMTRSSLVCFDDLRAVGRSHDPRSFANLCMVSCS